MNSPNLTLSILKNNKLFSAALFFIYTLVMSLLVMMSFFSESIELTFQDYMDEYGYPDAYVITSGTPISLTDNVRHVDGVADVWSCLSANLSTKLKDGKTLTLLYIGTGSEDFTRYYDVDTGESFTADDDTVAVYYYFARSNDILPGDLLTVKTSSGSQDLTVTNIVSCPETINVCRDSSSWYDLEDYAYIYIPESKMEELLGTPGYVNQFRLRFKDSSDSQQILARVLETAGLNAVSSTTYENSLVEKQLHAAVDSTKAIVTYVPAFIVLIGVLFSTLFIEQIIKHSYKTIALLRSLGYSNTHISGIYIRYSLILSTVSAILGMLLGVFMLKIMLQIYQNFYELPYLRYTGKWFVILILILIIQCVGAVSCLICSRDIGKVNPAVIFTHNMDNGGDNLPRWLERASIDAYTRISLSSAYRSRKRNMVTVLCYIACLVLTFLAIAILFTKNTAVDYVFEQRYPYDLLAITDTDEAEKKLSDLSCVETAEQRFIYNTEYEDEVMRIEAIPDGSITDLMDTDYRLLSVPESGIILEEGFARRHGLKAGDTVEIGGVCMPVQAVSRQYLCSVQYISFSQAQSFGNDGDNALAIILKDGSTTTEFSCAADEVEGYSYLVDMNHRRACATDALNQLNMPCYIFIVFAFVIGLVILYNMNNIKLSERKREYATLRILGAEPIRFLKMSILENTLQYVMTCVIGIPLSILISRFLLTSMSSVGEEYVLESAGAVSLISCGIMFFYIFAGVVVTQQYIMNINTLEALVDKE